MKQKTKTDLYDRLKKGDKIQDTWYGKGLVLERTSKNRLKIELQEESAQKGVHKYDREHVNEFIKKI